MATQVNICNLALRRLGADVITAIDDGSKNADHCNAFWDYILDEVLEDYSWNFAKKTATLNYTSGFGIYVTTDTISITGASQAVSCVITTLAPHGFLVGHTVYIDDIVGMTELNKKVWEISATDAVDTFQMSGVNSTDFTAYSSGGTVIRKEVDPKYFSGYTYNLPTDYLRALHLSDKSYEFEVLGTGNNRRLVTTAKDAILIYTALESTTTNMLNRFINAMAWRLAADLSIPLGKKGAKQEQMMSMYNYVLGKKSTSDARTQKQNLVDSDPWLNAGGFIV